jgi:hypothetical protein
MPLNRQAKSPQHSCVMWLAMLIAVFGALVHGGAPSMVEVCSATGRHWLDTRGVADGSPGVATAY